MNCYAKRRVSSAAAGGNQPEPAVDVGEISDQPMDRQISGEF